ncbi:MAG TPA: regulator SirB [Thiotrichaceae bacterium]|nr:regulator SirB [Thiotrichaceae bacterium]
MLDWYLIIKNIHLSCVVLTFISFSVRGLWMILESPWLQRRWVKIVPHFIDSVLLATGIALVIMLHQYPGVETWLTVKFVALLAYIIIGTIALKRGKTKTIRVIAWIGALGAFFYMVKVALTRVISPF